MDLRTVIVSAITLGSTSGGCVAPCNAEKSDFDLDELLTGSQIDAISATNDEDSPEPCEEACGIALSSTDGGIPSKLDSCTFELDPNYVPAVDTITADTAVTNAGPGGRVICAGTAYDHACLGGRRGLSYRETATPDATLGPVLAHLAHLEAASVSAFRELARDLVRFGAPAELVDRCRAAARDEIAHARMLRRLARAEGAVAVPVRTVRTDPADRRQVALHNATEGCVNEAWAALVARWQADHASTPGLRTVFARIADDETRHGQLSWDLHRWFLSTAGADERRELEDTRLAALASLARGVASQVAGSPPALGFPSPERATTLATHFGALAA